MTSSKFEHRLQTEEVLFDPVDAVIDYEWDNNVDQNVNLERNGVDFNHESSRLYNDLEDDRVLLELRRDTEFQTVLGFGGAFTDAAGRNIAKLKPETQVLYLQ